MVEASWVSFKSLPPKEAVLAVVLKDMLLGYVSGRLFGWRRTTDERLSS